MRKIAYFGKTDVGRIRTNNEDTYLVCNIWDDNHILAVVIDGVGGYEGGEVAAAIARESIFEYLQQNPIGERLELLKKAVIFANNKIYSERALNPDLSSMSCVLTASLVELDAMRVNIAHVGDTRLYQFASSQIEKLTHDHSLVGYREEIGELTEEEAMSHPQRNIISRDVGSSHLDENDSSYIEATSYPLEPKTQLLLCSDGLCDMITSVKMAQVMSSERNVQFKVEMLIEAALKAGGRDNVTVVLVDIESDEMPQEDADMEIDNDFAGESEDAEPASSRKSRKLLYPWIFVLIFFAGFAAGVLCSPLFFSGKKTVENKSADTTIVVEPADTLDSLGRDSLVLSNETEHVDTQIHQDVDNENQ